jgi:beta-aspartyl-peptidase (threonine type)
MGVEMADDAYFYTQHRYDQLLRVREEGVVQLDHVDLSITDGSNRKAQNENRKSIGTVGAVARDEKGDLAAATSTGGMTNKKFGRVGDTPLIGAGTYADNSTCAVSCTGHGEFFMLGVTAYDVAARMKYKGIGLVDSARETIDQLGEIGGEGGLIAVDRMGNVTMPFNSKGMYRGWIDSSAAVNVLIYQD